MATQCWPLTLILIPIWLQPWDFLIPKKLLPISEMKELIEERTGAKPGQPGSLFKLNPKVDDIPEKYAQKLDGIRLMVMGKVKRGGSGCYCAENTLLQALMAHLLVARNEVVILDMAAGIEHLGRATARAVDKLIIVVEPGRKSLETAFRIKKLAQDIGVTDIAVVGNKIRNDCGPGISYHPIFQVSNSWVLFLMTSALSMPKYPITFA